MCGGSAPNCLRSAVVIEACSEPSSGGSADSSAVVVLVAVVVDVAVVVAGAAVAASAEAEAEAGAASCESDEESPCADGPGEGEPAAAVVEGGAFSLSAAMVSWLGGAVLTPSVGGLLGVAERSLSAAVGGGMVGMGNSLFIADEG